MHLFTHFFNLSELKAKAQLLGESVQKLPGGSFEVPVTHKLNRATVLNGLL